MLEVKSKPVAKSSIATASKRVMATGEKMLSVSPAERYRMIAEAAYYHAERRGFISGDSAQDWLDAEAEIDHILQNPSEGKRLLMTAKQAFQQKLDAQLTEWDAKFDQLKAKALGAKDEMHADYEKQLEALAEKRTAAQAKMQDLRLRTEDAWEDLKGGTEKAWDEMRNTLDRIASRFK
jgi:basic membrane lipoprotein Med (substrate-binding protein (PBP1-ABC) superfamily)